jgi:hypothetical protein
MRSVESFDEQLDGGGTDYRDVAFMGFVANMEFPLSA